MILQHGNHAVIARVGRIIRIRDHVLNIELARLDDSKQTFSVAIDNSGGFFGMDHLAQLTLNGFTKFTF
jgi:hypothetical protein